MSTAAADVFDRSPYDAPSANLVGNAEATEDRLFSAEGRIGIWRYNARFAQLMFVVLVAAAVMFGAMATESNVVIGLFGVVVTGVALAAIVAMIFAAVKRLHDLGHSGWFYLIGIIPIVGALFTLYYSFRPGSEDDNHYGAPREPTGADKILGAIGMVLLVLVTVGSLIPMG